MNIWVDVTWPMMASASLTLGLIHAFVWMRQGSRTHLAFALAATSIAALTLMELQAFRAATPEELGTMLRWMQVPITFLVLAIVWFFHTLLGGVHLWIGLTAGGLRLLGLLLDFTTGVNVNFEAIAEVRQISWGGELVSYAVGTVNPWVVVPQLSNVVLIVFVALNMHAAWRLGDPDLRRTALVICGSWLVFIVLMVVAALTMMFDQARLPFLGSPSFLAVVLATSYQLGSELSRSALLSHQLRETRQLMTRTEQDFALATRAGELELWVLDVVSGTPDESLRDDGESLNPTTQALLQRVHEDDRANVERALARAFDDGRFEAEFRELTVQGEARWISARGEVEFDNQRRPHRLRAVARNVSETHAAAERFRSLFESAPLALMLIDSQGRITLANDLAAHVFGSTRMALEGSPVDTLLPERHREGPVGSAFALQEPVQMGTGREMQGLRADGSELSIEIGLKKVQFADGIYTLVTVTDISTRKRAEAETLQRLDELAHLSRVTMIGELSGSLAHELNQPLAAILSNVQAAQRILSNDPTDTKDLQEILADIVDDDRRAGEVIRRMRLLLKKGHVDHAPVDINGLVKDTLRLIRSDMIHRAVDARVELSPDIPEFDADGVQLQQVLVNLVLNACDAMDEGGGLRTVKIRSMLTPEGAVRVSVEDKGPGIRPEMLQRIFEPFETTKAQGMGLGLAVCRSILDAHGGRIWAENVAEGGARVSFEISRPGSRK